MSEGIIVALISGAGAIIGAAITAFGSIAAAERKNNGNQMGCGLLGFIASAGALGGLVLGAVFAVLLTRFTGPTSPSAPIQQVGTESSIVPEPTITNQPAPPTVSQTPVRSECVPPEGLVELWDQTQHQWSIGTWGTPNIADFTAELGTVDTNDPDFGEFKLWISSCNTETHGYMSGAQFWPKSPVNEIPYKPLTLGQIYIVNYIPVRTGLWSLGNPR
jgi:hypothetical protein